MSTGDRNALSLLGEQAKDNTSALPNGAHLLAYLRGLPSLAFSEKGCATICRRFGVSIDELTAAVAALQARPNRPTSELLSIIGTAVRHSHRAKGGAALC